VARGGRARPNQNVGLEKNPKIKASSNNAIPPILVLDVYTMIVISRLLRREGADWARVCRRWGRPWALPSRRRAPGPGADGRTRAVSRAVLYDSPECHSPPPYMTPPSLFQTPERSYTTPPSPLLSVPPPFWTPQPDNMGGGADSKAGRGGQAIRQHGQL